MAHNLVNFSSPCKNQAQVNIHISQKFLPISGTLVTDGNPDLLLDDDLSNDEADLLQRSSGIAGLDLLLPLPPRLFKTCPPELGPQVLPLTPSAGTIKKNHENNTWKNGIIVIITKL